MTASNPCCEKCENNIGGGSYMLPLVRGCSWLDCPCHKDIPAATSCKHNGAAHWVEGFGWKCDDCGGFSGNHGGAPGAGGHGTPAAVEGSFDKSVAITEEVDKRRQEASAKALEDYLMHQPAKDIEENLRLMNHGIIYQQPEKEWWEARFDEKMKQHAKEHGLTASTNNDPRFIWSLGFFEAAEIAKSFISKIAAQSEKKGRDDAIKAVREYFSGYAKSGAAFLGQRISEDALIEHIEAARSSEEGKTNNK